MKPGKESKQSYGTFNKENQMRQSLLVQRRSHSYSNSDLYDRISPRIRSPYLKENIRPNSK